MNMIRVWGGGIYESDWFYDCCDKAGLAGLGLTSQALQHFTGFYFGEIEFRAEDNYFDLYPGSSRTVEITFRTQHTLEELKTALRCFSYNQFF